MGTNRTTFATSTSGATIATPASGKWIRIVALTMQSSAAQTATLKGGAVDLIGAIDPPLVLNHNPEGWADLAVDEPLTVDLANGLATVRGVVIWEEHG